MSAIAAKGLIFQVFSLGLFLLFGFASIDRSAAEISFKKTTVTYREIDGHKILADVYHPQDAKIRPVIVWIHGGALIMGNRDLEKSDFLLAFAEAEGCAVVSVDYRLAPETKLPDIISDIEEAFRWLAGDGAKQFHLDPRRIVVAGASAGGYLTLARTMDSLRADARTIGSICSTNNLHSASPGQITIALRILSSPLCADDIEPLASTTPAVPFGAKCQRICSSQA